MSSLLLAPIDPPNKKKNLRRHAGGESESHLPRGALALKRAHAAALDRTFPSPGKPSPRHHDLSLIVDISRQNTDEGCDLVTQVGHA
jgi:hypothetical protein